VLMHLVQECLEAVSNVIVRAIALVATNAAAVAEPVARLTVACVQRFRVSRLVSGQRTAPLAVLAMSDGMQQQRAQKKHHMSWPVCENTRGWLNERVRASKIQASKHTWPMHNDWHHCRCARFGCV
jgi:hypothetical protein